MTPQAYRGLPAEAMRASSDRWRAILGLAATVSIWAPLLSDCAGIDGNAKAWQAMANVSADPFLSKFEPLGRILFADDFDNGMCGWSELIGNYEGSLDTILPPFRDLRPPMLSSATMWDTGTAGSLAGAYSLKLATRARAGHLAVAIKRATWRKRGRIQVECYFAVKPEPSALTLGDHDVGACDCAPAD